MTNVVKMMSLIILLYLTMVVSTGWKKYDKEFVSEDHLPSENCAFLFKDSNKCYLCEQGYFANDMRRCRSILEFRDESPVDFCLSHYIGSDDNLYCEACLPGYIFDEDLKCVIPNKEIMHMDDNCIIQYFDRHVRDYTKPKDYPQCLLCKERFKYTDLTICTPLPESDPCNIYLGGVCITDKVELEEINKLTLTVHLNLHTNNTNNNNTNNSNKNNRNDPKNRKDKGNKFKLIITIVIVISVCLLIMLIVCGLNAYKRHSLKKQNIEIQKTLSEINN